MPKPQTTSTISPRSRLLRTSWNPSAGVSYGLSYLPSMFLASWRSAHKRFEGLVSANGLGLHLGYLDLRLRESISSLFCPIGHGLFHFLKTHFKLYFGHITLGHSEAGHQLHSNFTNTLHYKNHRFLGHDLSWTIPPFRYGSLNALG